MPDAQPAMLDVPALHARGLCCGYRGVQVVHELDLSVAPGEIVAMLGANGAGKSTTLLTLAGVLPPISGTVELFGTAARGPLQRRARAGLGLLKETTSVFPTLTVAQNLALGRGTAERVYEIAPVLRPLQHRRGGLLSGGEQRILAVARALAAEPQVLLVDELSLGLAPRITDQLLVLLREHADRGTAILLVEQHPAAALAVADRAIVLRRGEIVLEAPARELVAELDRLHDLYFGS
jgi:branched-chain amino acid transport system ATP-binding protein